MSLSNHGFKLKSQKIYLQKDFNQKKSWLSLMDQMSVFFAHVVQQAAQVIGGIVINI
jgi:hypothetical protein